MVQPGRAGSTPLSSFWHFLGPADHSCVTSAAAVAQLQSVTLAAAAAALVLACWSAVTSAEAGRRIFEAAAELHLAPPPAAAAVLSCRQGQARATHPGCSSLLLSPLPAIRLNTSQLVLHLDPGAKAQQALIQMNGRLQAAAYLQPSEPLNSV